MHWKHTHSQGGSCPGVPVSSFGIGLTGAPRDVLVGLLGSIFGNRVRLHDYVPKNYHNYFVQH